MPEDFYINDMLSDEKYRSKLIEKALIKADSTFKNGVSFDSFYFTESDKRKGKKTYFSDALDEKVVLRKCVKNLISCSKVKLKSRSQIAKEIRSYLAEGTEYRVYKLDIKSFFESVNKAHIKKCLQQQPQLSTHTQNILLGYLSHFPDLLPRGLEFSPIIAELILKSFDKEIRRGNDVIYYSRFVDDILLITTKSEDKKSFLKKIRSTLPEGITLNYNKTRIIDVENRSAGSNNPIASIVAAFNYLGYKFEVQDYQIPSKQKNARYRKVIVDLSDSKVKQFESKLCKALVNYCNSGDFDLLNSRIKFLTTNRDLVQKSTGSKIPTGIYYNYSLIDPNSCALNRLDESLQKFVMGYDKLFHKPGKPTLSLNQKRRLLQSSFKSGFKNRIYKKFTPYWLKEITRIWQ
jgi:hypothetical protein